MKYIHLTIEEKEKIQEVLWQKSSIRTITATLNHPYPGKLKETADFNRYTYLYCKKFKDEIRY